MNSQATGECIDGTVARSVGVSDSCYTSQLSLAIGEEMVNETIECIYRNASAGCKYHCWSKNAQPYPGW